MKPNKDCISIRNIVIGKLNSVDAKSPLICATNSNSWTQNCFVVVDETFVITSESEIIAPFILESNSNYVTCLFMPLVQKLCERGIIAASSLNKPDKFNKINLRLINATQDPVKLYKKYQSWIC